MKPLALVAGALANKPHNGGAAWTRLSWMLGLRQMGFDVRFIETVEGTSSDRARDFFQRTLHGFGLEGILLEGDPAVHPRWEEAREWASQCAFLLNITGHLRESRLLKLVRRKAYLDLDPGYTQIWHHQGHDLGLQNHDLHFTVGENIGENICPIPADDFKWIPTRQPSLLDEWPVTPSPQPALFTTVASWRNPYGGLEFDGQVYGQKAHEFRRFIDLPQLLEEHEEHRPFPLSSEVAPGVEGGSREPQPSVSSGGSLARDATSSRRETRGVTSLQFELALDIHSGDEGDRKALAERGWRVTEARRLSTPEAFRRYVQDSGAEFSVAQGVYLHTHSGWFSDRTVRYLSSGRPALVQDTGLGHNIPLGDGLLTFRTLEEAADGVRRILGDYARHSRAARQLAQSHFDSRKILEAFLQRI